MRRDIGMTLVRQLLAAFAQLLLVVVIARQLGPEGNGYYALAILVPTILSSFLNLGVGPATVYYVSRSDYDAWQAKVGNLRLALIVGAVGVACMLPVLFFWGEIIFPEIPKSLLFLALASFPLSLMLSYQNTVLQGLEDFKAFNLTVLLPPYINLVGVVVALYVLNLGVAGAVVAYFSGQLVGVLVVFKLLAKRAPAVNKAEESVWFSAYAIKTLGYGWRAHLSNVLAFVNYRADIFLVNLFLTPFATGVYVIAVQMAEKLWMVSQAASTVLLPRLSAMHHNPEKRLALAKKGFWLVSAITAGASFVAAFALFWLIGPIFGEEYSGALPAFFWLLPGIVAGAGSRIYANCIAAAGKPEWNLYSALCVVTINVVGNVVLIPLYGVVGAAWATSAAYCFNAALKAWFVRKVSVGERGV